MNFIKNVSLILALFLNSSLFANQNTLKEHEKWWEHACRNKTNMEQFIKWQGSENAISRILVRFHINNMQYKSVLDIPCGLCVDYAPLKRSCPDICYFGMDISPLFINQVKEAGIPAMVGKIQNIASTDSTFDVVYSRYILEHLDSYEEAIKELVRVAKKEVIIVFFIVPDNESHDRIVAVEANGYPIYHNRYSRSKLEAFLKSLEKVKSFSWQEVKNKNECILHILL